MQSGSPTTRVPSGSRAHYGTASISQFVDRAIAKHFSDDPDGAFADVNQAIEMMPSYARAFLTRGLFYDALGKPRLALRDKRKAAELSSAESGDAVAIDQDGE